MTTRNLREAMVQRTKIRIAELTSDPTTQELALRMSVINPGLLPAGIETLEQVVKFTELAPDASLETIRLAESIKEADRLNSALGLAQLWFT